MATVEQRLSDQNYINWVKAGLCLNIFKTGIQKFAEEESKLLHQDIIAAVSGPGAAAVPVCGQCTNSPVYVRRKWELTCPQSVCDVYMNQLLNHHTNPTSNKICWNNTNVKAWPTHHWEMSKCYMNPGQQNNACAADCDGSALLNLFIHCNWYRVKIQAINKCADVRDKRNSIIHSGDMKCSTAEFTNFTNDIISILEDPLCLKQRPESVHAVSEVKKVRSSSFYISLEDANKVLLDTWTELKSELLSMEGSMVATTQQLTKLKQEIESLIMEGLMVATTQLTKLKQEIESLIKPLIEQHGKKIRSLEEQQAFIRQGMYEQGQTVKAISQSLIEQDRKRKQCFEEQEQAISDLKVKSEKHQAMGKEQEQKVQSLALNVETLKIAVDNQDQKLKREVTASTGTCNSSMTEEEERQLQTALCEVYEGCYTTIPASLFRPTERFQVTDLYSDVVILEEKKTEAKQKQEQKEAEYKQYKQIRVKSYHDIFCRKNEEGKKVRNIFLTGAAGRGKTTWCYQVVSRWVQVHNVKNTSENPFPSYQPQGTVERAVSYNQTSQNDEVLKAFKFLFYVPLRNVKENTSIADAICSYTLSRYPGIHKLARKTLEQRGEDVLIIIDGLDEYKDLPRYEGLHHGCTLVKTTRPWKLYIAEQSDDRPDLTLQLNGFDKKGVHTLTGKLLSVCYNSNNTGSCINSIQAAGLGETAKIPLLLNFLVHLWHENQQLSKSITDNIRQILECIISFGESRRNLDIPSGFRGPLEYVPQELQQENILSDPKMLLTVYGKLIGILGRLAFESLLQEGGDSALVFSKWQLNTYFGENAEAKIQFCLDMGLLCTDDASTCTTQQTKVFFYHKLIQEFFVAVHISCSKDAFEEFKKKCSSVRQILDVSHIIYFLCGINGRMSSQLSEYIVDRVIEVKDKLEARMISDMQVKCVSEMKTNGHKLHVVVIDDTVGPLVKSGKTTVRCVYFRSHPSKDFLEDLALIDLSTLTQLTKLVLWGITLPWSAWCSKLQSVGKVQSLHSLTLKDITLSDNSPPSFNIHLDLSTMTQLTKLLLWGITLPWSAWCSMLQSVGKVQSLHSLRLGSITLSDNSPPSCNIHLDLSTMTQLTKLLLWGITLPWSAWCSMLQSVGKVQSLHSLELRSIRLSDNSQPSCNIHLDLSTMTQLTELYLRLIALPWSAWCSMLQSVGKVQSLHSLTLWDIRLSDNSPPSFNIHLDLSTMTQLTKLLLWGITLPWSAWCSMLQSVGKVQSLHSLTLWDIRLSDNSPPSFNIHLDLSTMTQLIELGLITITLPWSAWCSMLQSVGKVQSLHSLELRSIRLSDNSQPSCNIHLDLSTLTQLTELVLFDITLPWSAWCSMLQSVGKVQSLHSLTLWDTRLSDNSPPSCNIHLDLSTMTQLTKLLLWGITLPWSAWCSMLQSVGKVQSLHSLELVDITLSDNSPPSCNIHLDLSTLTNKILLTIANVPNLHYKSVTLPPYIRNKVVTDTGIR